MHQALQVLRQEHSAIAQDEWRSLSQLLGQGPGSRQQILSWQDLIDQANFLRLPGGEGLAGEEKLAATIQPHEQRIEDVHAIAWHHSSGVPFGRSGIFRHNPQAWPWLVSPFQGVTDGCRAG